MIYVYIINQIMFFSEKIINKTYKNFFITYKKMQRFCNVFEKKCNVFATFLKKFATFCTNPCGNPTQMPTTPIKTTAQPTTMAISTTPNSCNFIWLRLAQI